MPINEVLAREEQPSVKDARKPITTRKPPVPSESHAEVDEWMRRRVMPDLQPIVQALDASIRDATPELLFAIRWKRAYYGLPELGWIIEVVPYDVSVNVVFLGGAGFDPQPPLGDTGPARYVKVKTLEEALGPEMRRWVEQSQRVPGWT